MWEVAYVFHLPKARKYLVTVLFARLCRMVSGSLLAKSFSSGSSSSWSSFQLPCDRTSTEHSNKHPTIMGPTCVPMQMADVHYHYTKLLLITLSPHLRMYIWPGYAIPVIRNKYTQPACLLSHARYIYGTLHHYISRDH